MITIKEIKTDGGKTEMSMGIIKGTPMKICEDILAITHAVINSLSDKQLQSFVKMMLMLWLSSEDDEQPDEEKSEKEEE